MSNIERERDAKVNDNSSEDESLADKLKLKKKDKKDKGYAHLDDGRSSEEELVDSARSATKPKKNKAFKLSKAKDKSHAKESFKPDKSSKSTVRKEKTKASTVSSKPVFGVSLSKALQRSRSHDMVPVPAVVRLCIDYVNDHGLTVEGIYRRSPPVTQVQEARYAIDNHQDVHFTDPHVAASLLKLFLRELPEPILPTDDIERAVEGPNQKEEVERLLGELPPPNYHLLAYLFLHMDLVIQKSDQNKMSLANVGLMLQPTLRFSQPLLFLLLSNVQRFFGKVRMKRYLGTSRSNAVRSSAELPSSPRAIEEEIRKNQVLLDALHTDLSQGVADPDSQNQIWDVQRVVTQLKRKLKNLRQLEQKQLQKECQKDVGTSGPCLEFFEEKQLWAVHMHLSDEIACEQAAIRQLTQMIQDAQRQGKMVVQGPEPDMPDETDWEALAKNLEVRRTELLESIVEERCKCAKLQAQIEMLTVHDRRYDTQFEDTRL